MGSQTYEVDQIDEEEQQPVAQAQTEVDDDDDNALIGFYRASEALDDGI